MNQRNITQHGGVALFWVLNDHCDRTILRQQLDAYQEAGIAALVLHPRNGLLLPYGSEVWFELIAWLVEECAQRNIEPILYDEDPYPSGNAGGRIVGEYPEYQAYEIQPTCAPDSVSAGELFLFSLGRLCWAGIIFPDDPGRPPIDLTAQVGIIRHAWEKAEWNSRWYYPATPVYHHSRAFTHHPEYGLIAPDIPKNGKLVAFVARPVISSNDWGTLVDSLNPDATRVFLDYTHDRYKHLLAHRFQKQIHSIFTDEPKPHSVYPWTPGIFDDFKNQQGYDLRPQLYHLFEKGESPEGMRVRTDFRNWVTQRFNAAWLEPVRAWCDQNKINLIGHLSPEEDLVNQSATLGNLFPLQKSLVLSGYDIILPAIGDTKHPLLAIAPLLACSTAQQNNQIGTCGESLALAGQIANPPLAAKILAWQALHGTTLAVIHAAYVSDLGLRRLEAPPDYGMQSPHWDTLKTVFQKITPFLQSTVDATQLAPVAILWPIRSFQALGKKWDNKDAGLRKMFLDIVQLCLNHQIGIHLLDEDDLRQGTFRNQKLHLGKAVYSHILLPPTLVLHETTLQTLNRLVKDGLSVIAIESYPQWQQPVSGDWESLVSDGSKKALPAFPRFDFQTFVQKILPNLPKILELDTPHPASFMASAWKKGSEEFRFLMNMGDRKESVTIQTQCFELQSGELVKLRRSTESQSPWVIAASFASEAYPSVPAGKAEVTFGKWNIAIDEEPSRTFDYPLGVWQIIATRGSQQIPMILTDTAYLGEPVDAQSVTYTTTFKIHRTFRKAILLLEPTLFCGNFTIHFGKLSETFILSDLSVETQHIDLTNELAIAAENKLTFILHAPNALDGIKHLPSIVLS